MNNPLISAIMTIADFELNKSNIRQIFSKIVGTEIRLILILDGFAVSSKQDLEELLEIFDISSQAEIFCSTANNPGGARNLGLLNAKSEWTVFWDCDDRPEIDSLLDFIKLSDLNEFDVCIGSYRIVERRNSRNANTSKRVITTDLLGLVRDLGLWRIMFRTNFIRGLLFCEYRMAEDQIYIFEVLNKNPKLLFTSCPFYIYGKNNLGSLTTSSEAFEDMPKALNKILTISPEWTSNKKTLVSDVIANLVVSTIHRGSLLSKLKLLFFLFRNIYRIRILISLFLIFSQPLGRVLSNAR